MSYPFSLEIGSNYKCYILTNTLFVFGIDKNNKIYAAAEKFFGKQNNLKKSIFSRIVNKHRTERVICSKFDCSKNLLDTILLLLDTIRAIIFFLVNCSKIKNHEKSSAVRVFRAVSLLDKKILTARISIG